MESLLSTLEDQAQRRISTPSIYGDLTLPILLYFPFRDPGDRVKLLSKRWSSYLDQILKSLPSYDTSVSCPNNLDKAMEIIQQIDPYLPTLCGWPGQWNPPTSVSQMNACQLANAINAMMSVPFKLIPITELVRIALDYPSCIEQGLFNAISNAHREFYRYLKDQSQWEEVYQPVQKPQLRDVNKY